MCYCRSSVALLCAYLALAFFIYFPSRFHTRSSQKLSVRPYESANRLHTIRFACLQKSGFARQPKFGKTGCAQSNPYHERFSLCGKHSRFSCVFWSSRLFAHHQFMVARSAVIPIAKASRVLSCVSRVSMITMLIMANNDLRGLGVLQRVAAGDVVV